jgi:uncharacterized membrane protein YdbT with pleckstrin-like domain
MCARQAEPTGRTSATQLPVIIRQSVLILFFKLLLLELTFFVLFVVLLILMQYAVVSLNMTDLRVLVLIYAMMNAVKGMMSVIAILTWVRHYYEIWPGTIIYKSGLLGRHASSFKLHNISTMEIDQSMIARMFHFGTIQLQNTFLKEQFYLVDIPHPQKNIQLIKASMEASVEQAPDEDE